jgi:hypothetical protein
LWTTFFGFFGATVVVGGATVVVGGGTVVVTGTVVVGGGTVVGGGGTVVGGGGTVVGGGGGGPVTSKYGPPLMPPDGEEVVHPDALEAAAFPGTTVEIVLPLVTVNGTPSDPLAPSKNVTELTPLNGFGQLADVTANRVTEVPTGPEAGLTLAYSGGHVVVAAAPDRTTAAEEEALQTDVPTVAATTVTASPRYLTPARAGVRGFMIPPPMRSQLSAGSLRHQFRRGGTQRRRSCRRRRSSRRTSIRARHR